MRKDDALEVLSRIEELHNSFDITEEGRCDTIFMN